LKNTNNHRILFKLVFGEKHNKSYSYLTFENREKRKSPVIN